jgi:adenylate kinase family enzyme
MTKIINLYGGPGTGKSTGAAYIFSMLKMHNINCELVTEYAKDRVWQEDFKTLKNQIYVDGKQYQRIMRLRGQVDYIITDSPILMGINYIPDDVTWKHEFAEVLFKIHCEDPSLNVFLKRVKQYNPKGRFQNEDEAKIIDSNILNLLKLNNVHYIEADGNKEGYDSIVNEILNERYCK